MKFSWFESLRHETGTKLPQFSISHHVHCSCKLFLLQRRNEPMSALCSPPCVLSPQHQIYAYTQRGLFPLHVSATRSRYRFPLHVPRNISPTVCRPYCRNAISEFSRTKTSAICNEKGIASWTSLVCYFCFIVFCLIYAAPQASSC